MRLCKTVCFGAFLHFFVHFVLPKWPAKKQICCKNVQKGLYAIPPLVKTPFACHRFNRNPDSYSDLHGVVQTTETPSSLELRKIIRKNYETPHPELGPPPKKEKKTKLVTFWPFSNLFLSSGILYFFRIFPYFQA